MYGIERLQGREGEREREREREQKKKKERERERERDFSEERMIPGHERNFGRYQSVGQCFTLCLFTAS